MAWENFGFRGAVERDYEPLGFRASALTNHRRCYTAVMAEAVLTVPCWLIARQTLNPSITVEFPTPGSPHWCSKQSEATRRV